jgi:NDP-sugar pyrophosphorylase family protein
MRAIILAGGKGSRLAPYTAVVPKPLMPVGDLPILEIVIRQLHAAGVTQVTLAVNHLASLIMAVINDGDRFGLKIDYSLEEQPLGTAGPIALVDGLEDDFLVMNGDILTDLDYRTLLASHKESGSVATIATYKKKVSLALGVLELGDGNKVIGYEEKPTLEFDVSTGIYVFSPEVLNFMNRGENLDLPHLIERLIQNGTPVHSFEIEGRWLDIGNAEDFERSSSLFLADRDRFLPPGD